MESPCLRWQASQPDYNLHRELSQTTKRGGPDFKPSNTTPPLKNLLHDNDHFLHTKVGMGASVNNYLQPEGNEYFDGAYESESECDVDYVEYMKNLSPCSSLVTKVSDTEGIPFDSEAIQEILKRTVQTQILPPPTDNTDNTDIILKYKDEQPSSTSTSNSNSGSSQFIDECDEYDDFHFQSLTEAVRFGMTKIELVPSSSCKKIIITINKLADYVEQELSDEINKCNIDREKILQTLTINHLLVYIFGHNPDIKFINQIRLFHLGRSYLADRGISDPRYFTLQYYLKDLRLDQSPCFNFFINESFDEGDAYEPSTCKKMLLKSFIWRIEVNKCEVSATYAENIFKRFKKVKSSIKNNIQIQDEEAFGEGVTTVTNSTRMPKNSNNNTKDNKNSTKKPLKILKKMRSELFHKTTTSK